ncbi:MAG: hypothetical protein MHPSP_001993 [Paramarteilia canceri]
MIYHASYQIANFESKELNLKIMGKSIFPDPVKDFDSKWKERDNYSEEVGILHLSNETYIAISLASFFYLAYAFVAWCVQDDPPVNYRIFNSFYLVKFIVPLTIGLIVYFQYPGYCERNDEDSDEKTKNNKIDCGVFYNFKNATSLFNSLITFFYVMTLIRVGANDPQSIQEADNDNKNNCLDKESPISSIYV